MISSNDKFYDKINLFKFIYEVLQLNYEYDKMIKWFFITLILYYTGNLDYFLIVN